MKKYVKKLEHLMAKTLGVSRATRGRPGAPIGTHLWFRGVATSGHLFGLSRLRCMVTSSKIVIAIVCMLSSWGSGNHILYVSELALRAGTLRF